MAVTLMEYLEGKGCRACRAFVSRPHYFQDGDYVTYSSSDQLAFEERIDELLTIYRSMETKELIGCKIKGVRRILETLGNFAVFVEGPKILLGLLFVGAALNRPESKEEYEKYSREYGQIAMDTEELPMAQAA